MLYEKKQNFEERRKPQRKNKRSKEAKERRDTEKLLVNFEFTLSDHHYTIHIMSLFVHDDEENDKSTIPLNFSEPDIVPVYPEKAINCILPLKYQQEIVEDTLTKRWVINNGLRFRLGHYNSKFTICIEYSLC